MGIFDGLLGDPPPPAPPPPPPEAKDVKTESGGNVQSDLNALAGELKPSKRRVMDPSLADAIETDKMQKDVAAPTNAPNRFTIYVPEQRTALSLGKEATGEELKSTDSGLRGHTDKHVNFHVRDPFTTVRLGSVSLQLDNKFTHGNQIGYFVGTDGFSVHQSKKSYGAFSVEGNLTLQAMASGAYVNLQANDGYAEVVGGKAVSVASKKDVILRADSTIVPPSVDAGAIQSGEQFAAETANTDWYATSTFWMGALDTILTGISFVQGVVEAKRTIKENEAGWKGEAGITIGKAVIDGGKLLLGVCQGIDDISNATWLGKHRVNILSGGNAGISADFTASIYGRYGSTLASALGASVIGGTAGVTGFLTASMWGGLEAAVTAQRVAKLESQFFKAIVAGKKVAEVQSDGMAALQGGEKVIVSAVGDKGTGTVFVHARTVASVTAGPSAGYALVVKENEVSMGQITSGSASFETTPTVQTARRVTINDQETSMWHGEAGLDLNNGQVTLFASKQKQALVLKAGGDVQIVATRRIFLDP